MKTVIFATLLSACLMFFGCSGDNAEALFETAKLEELQENHQHAIKLYQDMINQYPDHPLAEKARSRLSALEP